MNKLTHPHSNTASQIRVTGRVQGVGFRPFIYRIAHQHQLFGWVQNRQGEVLIHAEGSRTNIGHFVYAIVHSAPPISRPAIGEQIAVAHQAFDQFSIRPSAAGADADIHLPPDHFTCNECLDDLSDPDNRRYHYPFINCTQCGPRYTIIKTLPYDRPATSMAGFPLCPECEAEYLNPLDRRFHAEPVACHQCGPQLQFCTDGSSITDTENALNQTIHQLKAGKIIAIKGIGGYHLMCDARNDEAVQRLRQRKQRLAKPLAVIFPQRGKSLLDAVYEELLPTEIEAATLISSERPIVLCQKSKNSTLAPSIAPELVEVGAMLPYSPLHHLLLSRLNGPLVATSGNISGEPVITDNHEASQRLEPIADAFLHHNRPIVRPADDSLYRVICNHPRPLRLGRGVAPLEMTLSQPLPKTMLAVGGQTKSSVALAWGNRAVISSHIGDLQSLRSQQIFSQIIGDLQQLYQIKVEAIVCDAHPGYDSHRIAHRMAQNLKLPVTQVLHHHAHASAIYGELQGKDDWLVFGWDGTGMGTDHSLWGAEAFIGRPGSWQRFASLRPFRLPGGDKAGLEPWRSALALLWEAGEKRLDAAATDWDLSTDDLKLLHHAWQGSINTPQTSSAGRLFDAAAALMGLCHQVSYEGEAPSRLEAICQTSCHRTSIQLPLTEDSTGIWRSDWSPLIPMLRDQNLAQSERATLFHHTMAETIVQQAKLARKKLHIKHVGLTGGVFQNRLLTELATQHLERLGFVVHLSLQLPPNDGGLCYGQIIEATSILRKSKTDEPS